MHDNSHGKREVELISLNQDVDDFVRPFASVRMSKAINDALVSRDVKIAKLKAKNTKLKDDVGRVRAELRSSERFIDKLKNDIMENIRERISLQNKIAKLRMEKRRARAVV